MLELCALSGLWAGSGQLARPRPLAPSLATLATAHLRPRPLTHAAALSTAAALAAARSPSPHPPLLFIYLGQLARIGMADSSSSAWPNADLASDSVDQKNNDADVPTDGATTDAIFLARAPVAQRSGPSAPHTWSRVGLVCSYLFGCFGN